MSGGAALRTLGSGDTGSVSAGSCRRDGTGGTGDVLRDPPGRTDPGTGRDLQVRKKTDRSDLSKKHFYLIRNKSNIL